MQSCCRPSVRNTSTMCMNCPAFNQQSDIYMQRRDFQWKRRGSKRSNGAITTLGPLTTSQMLHTISQSLKKRKRNTCVGNDRVYAPPKRSHLTYFLTLPTHLHMKTKRIYLFASTSLRRQCTPIKWGSSHESPALATNASWSFINVNSNSSWAKAIKGNTGGKLILACAQALEQMQKVGIIPKHQVIDNKASAAYKKGIINSIKTYELVPPKDHQRNMAQKAIQTFKDHFVGILSGCVPTFPLHLWCQLRPQVEKQLLLL
jgi:hypothetical protein